MIEANEPSIVTDMYELMFDENHDTAPIRILKGKFKNFVYRYGTIQVGDFEEEDSQIPLKYDYELLEAPEDYKIIDEDHEATEKAEFGQFIGDILYDIIVNSETVKEAINGNRNDDSK
jgi:hypothetical protein